MPFWPRCSFVLSTTRWILAFAVSTHNNVSRRRLLNKYYRSDPLHYKVFDAATPAKVPSQTFLSIAVASNMR